MPGFGTFSKFAMETLLCEPIITVAMYSFPVFSFHLTFWQDILPLLFPSHWFSFRSYVFTQTFISSNTHVCTMSNPLSSSHLFQCNFPTFDFGCSAPFFLTIFCVCISILILSCIASTATYNASIILNDSYCPHVDFVNLILNCINFFHQLTIW